jgi:hypothetical protein
MNFRGELYNIMLISNIPSVLTHGILSNNEAQGINHDSIAMQEVQERRDGTNIPNGLALHDYANLYFDARNPMMYLRCAVNHLQEQLCVLVIDRDVMSLPNVVLADRNASCDFVQFLEPSQIDEIDFDKVYASDWRHPNNPSAYYVHRKIKCAEVLVPRSVPPQYIKFAHVVNEVTKEVLQRTGFALDIKVTPDMFFC